MRKRYKAIAAMAENRTIGKDNALPWNYPKDVAWFRKATQGTDIIMGRKTYDSLGRALPKRKNIVLTRDPQSLEGHSDILVFSSIDALESYETDKELMIIGGSYIYEALMQRCSDIYMTHIKKTVEGDTFFPPFETLFNEYMLLDEDEDLRIVHYRAKDL